MIYPLTKRERLRVMRCAENYIARIPDPERWQMLDGAHRLGLTTEIEIDLSDPTDVSVIWLGRKILTVPRQALRGKEPLEDHIVAPQQEHGEPQYPPGTRHGRTGTQTGGSTCSSPPRLDVACSRPQRFPP
jgi:hypothetical protein